MKYFSAFKYIYILLTLFAFSSSSSGVEVRFNGIYGYDLNVNSLVVEETDVLYEKYTYDEGCNFIHCGVDQSLKTQSEKTLNGSFFAFDVALVAAKDVGKNFKGHQNRQQRLKDLVNDDKVSSADRGWIRQEMNEVASGKKGHLRNPPGKDLANGRGRENAKGFGYEHAHLQNRKDHRTQHKLDNFGKKNKER